MDILFINLPYHRFFGQGNCVGIPYGMLSIATFMESRGFSAAVLDLDFDGEAADGVYSETKYYDHHTFKRNSADPSHRAWAELRSVLETLRPKIVGISMMTVQHGVAKRAAGIVRNFDKNISIVVGGPHPTVLPKETAVENLFDFVVVGEGEETMSELAREIVGARRFERVNGICYKEGGLVVSTAARERIGDLDSLPIPDRSLIVDFEKYPKWMFGTVMASRGCPFDCSFCNSKAIWGTATRFRTPENVVRELEIVHNAYGTREFNFLDDTFNFGDRAVRICDLIRERELDISWSCNIRLDNVTKEMAYAMASAGCYYVRAGVESGNQGVLNAMGKGVTLERMKKSVDIIRGAGMGLMALLILGDLHENESTMADSEAFVDELRADFVRFTMLIPYPRTRVCSEAERIGLATSKEWSDYTGLVPLVEIPGVSVARLGEKFEELAAKYSSLGERSFRRIATNPRYVMNRLRENAKSPRSLLRLLASAIRINFK
jgi:radical SAM superfamily enzyme YgiQ (UPF0313 family)